MKGHKLFLKIDFAIQTILIAILILALIPSIGFLNIGNDSSKMILPILAMWLIVGSTIEKINYKNVLRFKINRLWIIVFLIGLVFFIEKFLTTPIVFLIFAALSTLVVFANYVLVIYEYVQLEKESPAITHFEDILDDSDF